MPESIETRDGTRLFLLDWGAGAPIVFVHGFTLNADVWEHQMMHLAERGHRCVAYDRRGHGRSEKSWSGYDFDTLANDLADVLATLDLREVTLVGHSIGACEVVRYLSRHGAERVSRVVLVSAAVPSVLHAPDAPQGLTVETFEWMIAEMERDRPAYYASVAPRVFGDEIPEERYRWVMSIALQTSLRAAVGCTRAQSRDDFTNDLAAVTMPTLIVHGSADQSNPVALTAARAAAAIPNSQLIVYDGAPHGLPVTHAQRLSEDLLAFVTQDVGAAV